jgi:hypothetical protein
VANTPAPVSAVIRIAEHAGERVNRISLAPSFATQDFGESRSDCAFDRHTEEKGVE